MYGEVCESADFAAVLNIEYKPNTDQKYMVISLVKRRSIDTTESKYAKYTYLAHPFSKTNGFRLLDDMNLKKELSVQSLVTDILAIGKEKTNAVPRLKSVEPSEFEESKDT
jgi:hypothetical protein